MTNLQLTIEDILRQNESIAKSLKKEHRRLNAFLKTDLTDKERIKIKAQERKIKKELEHINNLIERCKKFNRNLKS